MRHGRSVESGRPIQVQMFWPPRSPKHHRKHTSVSTYGRKASSRDRYGKYLNGIQQTADIIAGNYSFQEKK